MCRILFISFVLFCIVGRIWGSLIPNQNASLFESISFGISIDSFESTSSRPLRLSTDAPSYLSSSLIQPQPIFSLFDENLFSPPRSSFYRSLDSVLFVAANDRLLIYNATDIYAIFLIGQYMYFSEPAMELTSLVVYGDLVFCVGKTGSLAGVVIDVSDIENPDVLFTTADNIFDWKVKGDYAFAAAETMFNVYDFSDLQSPSLVNFVSGGDFSLHVSQNNDIAYTCGGDSCTIRMYNISEPRIPVEIHTVVISPCVYSFHVYVDDKDEYLYVFVRKNMSPTEIIQIYDVSDPKSTSTTPVGETSHLGDLGITRDTPRSALLLKDDILYLSSPFCGLIVINVTDKSAPYELKRVKSCRMREATPLDCLEGGYAISFDDPEDPKFIFQTGMEQGIFLMDISNLTDPKFVGGVPYVLTDKIASDPEFRNFILDEEGYGYLCGKGVRIVDLRDARKMSSRRGVTYEELGSRYCTAIGATNGYIYVMNSDKTEDNFRIYDFRGRRVPVEVGRASLNVSDGSNNLAVDELGRFVVINYYEPANRYRVMLVNVTSKENPEVISTSSVLDCLGEGLFDVDVYGDMVYLAGKNGVCYGTMDSDGFHPWGSSLVPANDPKYCFSVRKPRSPDRNENGTVLALCDVRTNDQEDNLLYIFDVSSREMLMKENTGRIGVNNVLRKLEVNGDYAFISFTQLGPTDSHIYVFENVVTNPNMTERITSFVVRELDGLTRRNFVRSFKNYIYVIYRRESPNFGRIAAYEFGSIQLSGMAGDGDCGTTQIEVRATDPIDGTFETLTFNLTIRDTGNHGFVDSDKCVGSVCSVLCSEHGDCVGGENGWCACHEYYYGEDCRMTECNGVLSNLTSTCTSQGKCVAHDNCYCDDGFYGEDCEWATICNDIKGDVPEVCNGHGGCRAKYEDEEGYTFYCDCDPGYVPIPNHPEECREEEDDQGEGNNNIGAVVVEEYCCFLKGDGKDGAVGEFGNELDEIASVAKIKMNKTLFEISFDEIKIISTIGEGGSNSVVYKAKWKGKIVAFKCFKTKLLMSAQDKFDEFEKEVEVMSSVAHPNVINFYGCSVKPPRVGIVMEFCGNGELFEFVKKYREENNSKRYPISEKMRMCLEVCSAMEYLHSRSIIHRDLKSENILVDGSESTKLMDFGVSKIVRNMEAAQTRQIGTSLFMAPEVVLGQIYNSKVDVFSFGIFFFLFMTEEENPYDREAYGIENAVANNPNMRPSLEKLKEVVTMEGGEGLSEFATKVANTSWQHDPAERPDFKTLFGMFEEKNNEIKDDE